MDLQSLVELDSLEKALPELEKHAEAVRSGTVKAGSIWDDIKAAPGHIADYAHHAIGSLPGGESVRNWWDTNPHQHIMRDAAIGGLGGAALGGLGSLAFGPAGRRRPLAGAMMGGALGAMGGAGYGMAMGAPQRTVPNPAGQGPPTVVPAQRGIVEALGLNAETPERPRDPRARAEELRTGLGGRLSRLETDIMLSGRNNQLEDIYPGAGAYSPFLRFEPGMNAMMEGRFGDMVHALVPPPRNTFESHPGTHAAAGAGTLGAQALWGLGRTPSMLRAADPEGPFVNMSRSAVNWHDWVGRLPGAGNPIVAGEQLLDPSALANLISRTPATPGSNQLQRLAQTLRIKGIAGGIPEEAIPALQQLVTSSNGEANLARAMTHGLPYGGRTRSQLLGAIDQARGGGVVRGLGRQALSALWPHAVTQLYANQIATAQRLQEQGAPVEALNTVRDMQAAIDAARARNTPLPASPQIPNTVQPQNRYYNDLRGILGDYEQLRRLRAQAQR